MAWSRNCAMSKLLTNGRLHKTGTVDNLLYRRPRFTSNHCASGEVAQDRRRWHSLVLEAKIHFGSLRKGVGGCNSILSQPSSPEARRLYGLYRTAVKLRKSLICNGAAFADNVCVVDFDMPSKEKAVTYLGNLCQCLGYNDSALFFNIDLDLSLLDIGIRFNSEGALQITHLKNICSNIEQARATAETYETNQLKQSSSEIPGLQPEHGNLYNSNSTTEKDAEPNIVIMTTESSILDSYQTSDETTIISPTLFEILVPNNLTQINNIPTQSEEPKQEASSTPMLESLTSYKTEELFTIIDILNSKYSVQTVSPEVESITYFSTEATMAKDTVGLSTTDYLTTEDASTSLDTSSPLNEIISPETAIYDTSSTSNEISSTEMPINDMSSPLNEIISPKTAVYDTSSMSNEIISTELPIDDMSSTLNEIISTDKPMPEKLPTLHKLKTEIAITERNTKNIIGLSTASYLLTEYISTSQKDTSSTLTETPIYKMLSILQSQDLTIQNAITLKDNVIENILVANLSTTEMSPITDHNNLRVRHSTNEPTAMSTISNEITTIPNVTSYTTPSEKDKRNKCSAELIRNDLSHSNIMRVYVKCMETN